MSVGTSACSTIETMEQVCLNNLCIELVNDVRVDIGKVLAGIQVPQSDAANFDDFLQNLGYPYVEETNNLVYKRYFRG